VIAVDISALVAIGLNEPEPDQFLSVIRDFLLLYKGNDFSETDLRPAVAKLPGESVIRSGGLTPPPSWPDSTPYALN
jgi:uncharacterized protein with PIN domain